MTAVLVALALTTAGLIGWCLRGVVDGARALDAHLNAVRAEIFAESGERLYDQLQALDAAITPELTSLRDKALRWRGLALRGRSTA